MFPSRSARSRWPVRPVRPPNTRMVLIVLALLTAFQVSRPLDAGAQQMEDVVYLHDGSILRGLITEQVPGESILIRTRDGNVFRITMDRIARMTKEPVQGGGGGAARQMVAQQKSPGVAFLLSFLIPGVGQIYNGDYAKGGIMLGATVIGRVLLVQTWEDCWEDDVDCATWGVGALLGFGSWIWAMIDAPTSASAINRRAAGLALEIGPNVIVASRPAFRAVWRQGALTIVPSHRLNIGVARVRF